MVTHKAHEALGMKPRMGGMGVFGGVALRVRVFAEPQENPQGFPVACVCRGPSSLTPADAQDNTTAAYFKEAAL